jgi:hypothetical protein
MRRENLLGRRRMSFVREKHDDEVSGLQLGGSYGW